MSWFCWGITKNPKTGCRILFLFILLFFLKQGTREILVSPIDFDFHLMLLLHFQSLGVFPPVIFIFHHTALPFCYKIAIFFVVVWDSVGGYAALAKGYVPQSDHDWLVVIYEHGYLKYTSHQDEVNSIKLAVFISKVLSQNFQKLEALRTSFYCCHFVSICGFFHISGILLPTHKSLRHAQLHTHMPLHENMPLRLCAHVIG